ncbi:hypothetical protein C8J56DRAFT_1171884 [Mycena floridula]|nr:hypothetical protein C8J56DRAFT_1171884 [Mycena floridula]
MVLDMWHDPSTILSLTESSCITVTMLATLAFCWLFLCGILSGRLQGYPENAASTNLGFINSSYCGLVEPPMAVGRPGQPSVAFYASSRCYDVYKRFWVFGRASALRCFREVM